LDLLLISNEEWKNMSEGKIDKAPPVEDHLFVVFVEYYFSKKDAMRREEYFKTSTGKRVLRLMLTESLLELSKTLKCQ
jgi:predicted GIY-YIG superfamily endonuclease